MGAEIEKKNMMKSMRIVSHWLLTDKNGIHGIENLATYFWYLGSFDEKRSYKNM